MRVSFSHFSNAIIALCLTCICVSAADDLGPTTGTYKDALRKAGEAGEPLMIEFYDHSYIDCKRQYEQMQEIPETMKKFVHYRINGRQNSALTKQFAVKLFPTLLFLKPDGSEFHRQSGIHGTPELLKNALNRILYKGGPIAKSQKQREPPSDKTPKGAAERQAYETAAANELRAAMNNLNVGRKKEATKAFDQIVSKYPDSKAAGQAQEQLDDLEPEEKER